MHHPEGWRRVGLNAFLLPFVTGITKEDVFFRDLHFSVALTPFVFAVPSFWNCSCGWFARCFVPWFIGALLGHGINTAFLWDQCSTLPLFHIAAPAIVMFFLKSRKRFAIPVIMTGIDWASFIPVINLYMRVKHHRTQKILVSQHVHTIERCQQTNNWDNLFLLQLSAY